MGREDQSMSHSYIIREAREFVDAKAYTISSDYARTIISGLLAALDALETKLKESREGHKTTILESGRVITRTRQRAEAAEKLVAELETAIASVSVTSLMDELEARGRQVVELEKKVKELDRDPNPHGNWERT